MTRKLGLDVDDESVGEALVATPTQTGFGGPAERGPAPVDGARAFAASEEIASMASPRLGPPNACLAGETGVDVE